MVDTSPDLHGAFQDNEIHKAWESVYRSGIQRAFNERLMTRILHRLALPPESLILDAGCGTGEHTLRLAEHGFKCVGVDISRSVVEKAGERARTMGLQERVTFICDGLEQLPFADAHFDAIHCRGVLMHIPRWQQVVAELCRVVRPGGKVLILEGNHHALETYLVRVARLFRRSESRMVRTPGGIEFLVTREGQAPLSRMANVGYLIGELQRHGVRVTNRIATEFWDLNRFPAGAARKAAALFNRAWLTLRLPARLSGGNAVMGEKLLRK
jgi:ubiquinone/menaquinone biosynthesis C-methylase UbiE